MESPIINWDLSVELAGNNVDHAKEYLTLLANDLAQQIKLFRLYFAENNLEDIKKHAHKLLGALSYCGATRLRIATKGLNDAIQQNANISLAFKQFESECDLLLKTVKQEIK